MAKYMYWSIFKDSLPGMDLVENHVAFYFNHDINASSENRLKFLHDGEYEVFYERESRVLRVVDGRWDVEDAKRKIGEMVEAAGYWGAFIEGFHMKNGRMVVSIGS